MNIHHLELFYYVAKFGGITEAVRNIPYGIQQPAVSAQIIQLEEHLEVTLFHRRPFALTPAGLELQAFVTPFFSNLDAVADKIRGGAAQQIRIGASEVVQRDHLPDVISNLRKKYPNLKPLLREGYRPQLEAWLQDQELDLAITLLEGKPPAGINTRQLISLPLALLVERSSRLRTADELWNRDRIDQPLIALPAAEGICRHFQQSLAKRGIDWFTSLEVSSLALVETYVASGFGIGLSLDVPKALRSPKVRIVPLPDFSPVVIGAMWTGKSTPLLEAVLAECQRRADFLRS
jgi:DNA-binding transcriptional LysR family regulator